MVLSSTTDPSNFGMSEGAGDSWAGNLVLTYPVAASQTITNRGFLTMDATGHVSINSSKEAAISGIAMAAVDNSSGAAADKYCPVLLFGITTVDALVQDTNASSGFDADIDVGQEVFVGGDGGTLVADGQAAVAGDGTDGVTTNPLGIALDACDGSTTADTLYKLRVFVNFTNRVYTTL